MSQIINITSEALQATIRRLLPSQQGFGEDLQASNVITPVIDLTPSAEGSILREDLQTAWTLTDCTVGSFSNNTGSPATLVNTPGFWRVQIQSSIVLDASNAINNIINVTDGLSSKQLYLHHGPAASGNAYSTDFSTITVLLSAGQSLTGTTNSVNSQIKYVLRQIANNTGDFNDPAGFVSQ